MLSTSRLPSRGPGTTSRHTQILLIPEAFEEATPRSSGSVGQFPTITEHACPRSVRGCGYVDSHAATLRDPLALAPETWLSPLPSTDVQ